MARPKTDKQLEAGGEPIEGSVGGHIGRPEEGSVGGHIGGPNTEPDIADGTGAAPAPAPAEAPSAKPAKTRRVSGRTIALFALVVLGSALGNMSQTALNAMMPSVVATFGVGIDTGQWFTTSYMLVLGIAVPVATYLSRKLGERAYSMLGLGLFAVGCLVDVVAANFWAMLLGRVVQAVAVALLMPQMQTMAIVKFPPGKQATAMGIGGIALGFAPNIGPTIGGAMEFAFGWRSFFLLLCGALVAMVLAVAAIAPKGGAPSADARFEGPSFVFSTLGFGGVLLGLSNASTFGLASPYVWAPLAVGAAFIVLFVRRQRRVPEPLMDLAIFRVRNYRWGIAALAFMFGSFMGVTLVIPLYVQDLCGGTSLEAGMVMLPATIIALIFNPVSGIMTDKLGSRPVALIFSSFMLVGAILWLFIDQDTPTGVLMFYQAIRAVGISGLVGPLQMHCLKSLEPRLISDGSSMTVLARQVAASFGTSIMVFAITATVPLAAAGALPAALPYQLAFGFSALTAACAFACVVARVK